MPRANRARLARLAARRAQPGLAVACHRQTLEARVAIGAVLRHRLPQLGVDPAEFTMLRVCDEAAAELAALPDLPGPDPSSRRQPQPRRLGVRGGKTVRSASSATGRSEFEKRIEALAQRFRDEPGIDFAHASLVEGLAWCAAQLPAADLLQKQRDER